MSDAIRDLAHDHAALNRQVLALSKRLRKLAPEQRGAALEPKLRELCDVLFLHFAREEEGLFPFIAETAPRLKSKVNAMLVAHDTICGALARMVHMAASDASAGALLTLFERFECAYADHSELESTVLSTLDARLDAAQRARLTVLVDGL